MFVADPRAWARHCGKELMMKVILNKINCYVKGGVIMMNFDKTWPWYCG